MTTPAEELRAAAVLLRRHAEMAESLMPGPWRVVITDSESSTGVASCPDHASLAQFSLDACDYCDVVETHSESVAAYTATVHPDVGLALADHLDAVAASAEWLDAKVSEPLTRLARLILAGGGS